MLSVQAFAQGSLVNSYYDSVNDWFVFEYNSPNIGPRKAIYDSPNKVAPLVKMQSEWDVLSEKYLYTFAVSNGENAKQALDHIVIIIHSKISNQTAPSRDWDASFYKRDIPNMWSWAKLDGVPAGIPTGAEETGFSFKSSGLPSIIEIMFSGEKRVRFEGPSSDSDPMEIHEAFDKAFEKFEKEYPDSKSDFVKSKTIGPQDPPADFKPVDFINYIIDLKHQAQDLGWITSDGIVKSLDKKL